MIPRYYGTCITIPAIENNMFCETKPIAVLVTLPYET